jgi:hypothetical protein
MVGAGGLVTSIIALAVGAILDLAVTVSPYQHGFNVNKVGVILMVVGAAGTVVSMIGVVLGNASRRRPAIDDGQGNFVHRADSSF